MKAEYKVIINGYEQRSVFFRSKENVYEWIKELRADGRIEQTDKIIIKTIIVIEDEVNI